MSKELPKNGYEKHKRKKTGKKWKFIGTFFRINRKL